MQMGLQHIQTELEDMPRNVPEDIDNKVMEHSKLGTEKDDDISVVTLDMVLNSVSEMAEEKGYCNFDELCPRDQMKNREVSVYFYKILKLERLGQVKCVQETVYGPIMIYLSM